MSDAIATIAEEIDRERGSKCLNIYLLGLLTENKTPTAAAFKPIFDRMAGSCIDDYSQCRGAIDALSRQKSGRAKTFIWQILH